MATAGRLVSVHNSLLVNQSVNSAQAGQLEKKIRGKKSIGGGRKTPAATTTIKSIKQSINQGSFFVNHLNILEPWKKIP